MNTRGVLLLLGLLGAVPVYAAEPSYDRFDAMVAMSDGVQLDASLYIPKQAGVARLPLIVRQHGGGSNKESPFDVKYGLQAVATQHFALLMYSARGHGSSEGLFDFFGPRTTLDFSEMLDWVAVTHGDRVNTDQVGAVGYSQGGGESLLPAAHDARVKVLAVGNTFADLNYALNPNDCYKFSFATGIFLGAYTSTASRVDDSLAARWGAQFMSDTEDVGAAPVPSTTADLESRSPQTYVDALVARKVPVFWTNGWEDQLFPADHPQRMLSTLERNGVPVHYWFASGGHAAGASFPLEEAQREQAMLNWFEQFINGAQYGFLTAPKVDYWQRISGAPRQGGEWEHHTATAWPIADATVTSLYPRADGALGAERAPESETATLLNDAFSANFANDALIHEIAGNAPGLGDILNQVPEGRNPLDTITYTSLALTQPLNVVGAPEVTITQDSTRSLVQQLDAKVWDIGAEGAQLIWRGGTSGLLGNQVSFKLWPNAHRFEPGHKIVLTISSVDFPTYKPDIEPWRANILLSATRLDLPTTASQHAQSASSANRHGGAMTHLALLLALLGWRRISSLKRVGARSG